MSKIKTALIIAGAVTAAALVVTVAGLATAVRAKAAKIERLEAEVESVKSEAEAKIRLLQRQAEIEAEMEAAAPRGAMASEVLSEEAVVSFGDLFSRFNRLQND